MTSLPFNVLQVEWLPEFYSFPDSVGIAGSDAYKNGRIYGLDAASGAAVIALDPKPGHHVLDLCAAPGDYCSHIIQIIRNMHVR